MNMRFDALYPSATEPYKSQLTQFRLNHTPRELQSAGVRWSYLIGGTGDEVILVLHGGGGPAESLFRYIQVLEERFRVVAPTIPAGVVRVAEALDAIVAILDREEIAAVHLFGVSNGGMLGQCLIRRCPERVLSLVLFLSMLPSPPYARLFQRRARIFGLMPRWLSVALSLKWLKKQLSAEIPNTLPAERLFWQAYFQEMYHSDLVTKPYLVSRATILTDYFGNYHFEPHDLDDWGGRVLIIESDQDQVINQEERARLKAFYQQAETLTLQGMDHMTGGLFRTEQSLALIERFFQEVPVSGKV